MLNFPLISFGIRMSLRLVRVWESFTVYFGG